MRLGAPPHDAANPISEAHAGATETSNKNAGEVRIPRDDPALPPLGALALPDKTKEPPPPPDTPPHFSAVVNADFVVIGYIDNTWVPEMRPNGAVDLSEPLYQPIIDADGAIIGRMNGAPELF